MRGGGNSWFLVGSGWFLVATSMVCGGSFFVRFRSFGWFLFGGGFFVLATMFSANRVYSSNL